MRVRLLGPVDVLAADDARPIAGLRRRAVLATLGLTPDTVVAADRLIEIAWNGRPPATPLNSLQQHVSQLRNLLGQRDAILARPPGYLLHLGNDATHVQVAVRLIDEARRIAEPTGKLGTLRAALDLWRGRALADLEGLPWLDG